LKNKHALGGVLHHNEENTLLVKNNKRNEYNNNKFLHCVHPYCNTNNHQYNKCWWRPDAKWHKCDQSRHMEKVSKSQDPEEDV